MKDYEFHCGGGRGAWECDVTVSLTEKEEYSLKEYAQDHEMLDWDNPDKKIWFKVMKELEEQCDDDADFDDVVVWVPYGLKK